MYEHFVIQVAAKKNAHEHNQIMYRVTSKSKEVRLLFHGKAKENLVIYIIVSCIPCAEFKGSLTKFCVEIPVILEYNWSSICNAYNKQLFFS